MSKEEDSSWLQRLKQFLHLEPQDEEELLNLLRDAQIRALIDVNTLTMLEGVLLFSKLKVREIMLPRKQITVIPENASLAEIISIVTTSGHSRFPIVSKHADEVLGILHAKDLLRFFDTPAEDFNLLDIARQATFVPESKRLDALLGDFRHNRNHMALVVDEYGVFAGFVTIEDIIEQIIGDIADEFDIDEEACIKAHDNMHYIIKAKTPIADFNDAMDTNFSDDNYDTIGGIITARFGYMPHCGEKITIDNLEFKVINADARRIKLLECIDHRSTHEQ